MKQFIKKCERVLVLEKATAIKRYFRFINGIWQYRIKAKTNNGENITFDYYSGEGNEIFYKAYLTK